MQFMKTDHCTIVYYILYIGVLIIINSIRLHLHLSVLKLKAQKRWRRKEIDDFLWRWFPSQLHVAWSQTPEAKKSSGAFIVAQFWEIWAFFSAFYIGDIWPVQNRGKKCRKNRGKIAAKTCDFPPENAQVWMHPKSSTCYCTLSCFPPGATH